MITTLYNGNPVDEGNIPLNRGLLYADGFFETCLYQHRKISLAPYHQNRIIESCRLMKLDIPNIDQIFNTIDRTINNSIESYRVRISFFRCLGGFYKPLTDACDWMVTIEPYHASNKELCILSIEQEIKKNINPWSNIKSINCQLYTEILLKKEHQESDEVLIFNINNHVCETTSSNIFWTKNNCYYTPDLQTGCVKGVMRSQLIDSLKSDQIQIIECSNTLEHLLDADDIYITNALQGVRKAKLIV